MPEVIELAPAGIEIVANEYSCIAASRVIEGATGLEAAVPCFRSIVI
jgi:hypothetical protein